MWLGRDYRDTKRLVGSSEILESRIGKYEQVRSPHSKSGMTAMPLSFGAIVTEKPRFAIVPAFRHTTTATRNLNFQNFANFSRHR